MNVAMLVVGIVALKECQEEPMIPIYLVGKVHLNKFITRGRNKIDCIYIHRCFSRAYVSTAQKAA